jgi:hypothetical protein
VASTAAPSRSRSATTSACPIIAAATSGTCGARGGARFHPAPVVRWTFHGGGRRAAGSAACARRHLSHLVQHHAGLPRLQDLLRPRHVPGRRRLLQLLSKTRRRGQLGGPRAHAEPYEADIQWETPWPLGRPGTRTAEPVCTSRWMPGATPYSSTARAGNHHFGLLSGLPPPPPPHKSAMQN